MISVTGPVLKSDGAPFIGRMRLTPVWPMAVSGQAVISDIKTVNAPGPDGVWDDDDMVLRAGVWMIAFPSAPGSSAVYLIVPKGNGEMAFADMMSLAPAEVASFYTQEQVDALLAASVGIYFINDVAALRAVATNVKNKFATLVKRQAGEPREFYWDGARNDADDPAGFTVVRPNDFVTAGSMGVWVQAG